MGISKRFGIVLGAVSLVVILCISAASYWLSIKNAQIEAEAKGELIFLYQTACLHYFSDKQIPLATELVEKERFYPELMSAFAASRLIHENFRKALPTYDIKYASLNPLLKSNMANEHESKIIKDFAATKNETQKKGFIQKNSSTTFFLAKAVNTEPSCLQCHGTPETAPKDQVAIYGATNGYNWKPNETISAFFVYVPFDQVLANARSNAISIFAMGTILFLIAIFIISIYFNSSIVKPITWLRVRSEEISLGEKLDEKIPTDRNDEIGELSKAINRLRISINKMQKML